MSSDGVCQLVYSEHKTNQSVALQDAPATFWPVVTSSVTCSAITFVLIYGYWKFWPNRRHRRRVKDMAAMRDLLVHHMDDLDDIMDKLHLHSGNLKCTEGFRVQGLGFRPENRYPVLLIRTLLLGHQDDTCSIVGILNSLSPIFFSKFKTDVWVCKKRPATRQSCEQDSMIVMVL